MPVGNILVSDTRGNIEHNYSALALNIISVTETTKLFLACCIPDIEPEK